VEKKFPFSPISSHGGLEIWNILFGQVIPEVAQLNLHIGETGAGSIAGFSEIALHFKREPMAISLGVK
jgi:hypothetical protein